MTSRRHDVMAPESWCYSTPPDPSDHAIERRQLLTHEHRVMVAAP